MTLDAIRGAVAYIADEYGDYGYRITGIDPGIYGGGHVKVRHLDGSEFTVRVDRAGNAHTLEDERPTTHSQRMIECTCGCGATMPDNGLCECGAPMPCNRTPGEPTRHQ
jgi:hypothetical protein